MASAAASLSVVIITLMFAIIASGCGQSQRERTLRATFVATNAARDGFTKYDRDQQQKIAQTATSIEAGQAALAAYRKKRDEVVVIFEDVYRALVAATLANDTGSLDAAKKAAERLKKALDDLMKLGEPPP